MDPASERSGRTARRVPRRIAFGGWLGLVIGAVIGGVVGLVFFDGTAAILTTVLAGALGLGMYGAFVGGMSGLESPNPGEEPSDRDEPLDAPPVTIEDEPPTDR